MQSETPKRSTTQTYGVVAAVFKDCSHANDAVADLNREGFSGARVGVACPSKSSGSTEAVRLSPGQTGPLGEEHSLIWRLRRSFEHDLHRSGHEQMAGDNKDHSKDEPFEPYTQIDLWSALGGLGMQQDSIGLLHMEMGDNGAFVIVDAGHSWEKAEAILEKNSGVIRSDAVTNRTPAPKMEGASYKPGPGSQSETFQDN